MNSARENYLLNENEMQLDSVFGKMSLYNQRKVSTGRRMNESVFNARYDIRFNESEQKAIKDLFKIIESRLINSYEQEGMLNEGLLDRAKAIKDFFVALAKKTVKTTAQLVNTLLEMISKFCQNIADFVGRVFGFDGYDSFKLNDEKGLLKDIPSEQQGFVAAVQAFCQNNINNQEIKQANKELGNSLNEGFDEKVDNFLKTNKVINNHPILTAGFYDKDSGKISKWKTIAVSIVGSLLLCTIIPFMLTSWGVSLPVVTVVTIALKVIWVARGVLKVLYHRSKTKGDDQKIFNFWTVLQIALVVGTPILFAIPGVKEAFNQWISDVGGWVCDKLGIKDGVKLIMEKIGLGTSKQVGVKWRNEILPPDEAQNALIGSDAVVDAVYKTTTDFRGECGSKVAQYIPKVTKELGLDNAGQKAMTKFMQGFNNLTITGEDVYSKVFGQLKGCKTLQIGVDTNVVKRTFGGTKKFLEYLYDELKSAGVDVTNSDEYSLINQAAFDASGGNRGVIDCFSLEGVKATKENIVAVNKVLWDVVKKAPQKMYAGVLNSPENFVKKIVEPVKSFITNFDLLYTPRYKKEKPKDASTGGQDSSEGGGIIVPPLVKDGSQGGEVVVVPEDGGLAPTDTAIALTTTPIIEGDFLHNNVTNLDYPLTELRLVPYNEVKTLLPSLGELVQKNAKVEWGAAEASKNAIVESFQTAKRIADEIIRKQFGDHFLNEEYVEGGDGFDSYEIMDDDGKTDGSANSNQNVITDNNAYETITNFNLEKEHLKNLMKGNFNVVVMYGSVNPVNGEQQQGNGQNNQKQTLSESAPVDTQQPQGGQTTAMVPVNSQQPKGQSTDNALVKTPNNQVEATKKGEVAKTNNNIVPLIAFSPIFGRVGVNPKIVGNNIQEFLHKGMFEHYTFKAKNQESYTKCMRTLMANTVLQTYEVIKFTGTYWKVLSCGDDNMICPGENPPQGGCDPLLCNFTVEEFCGIHSGRTDAFPFYDAKYAKVKNKNKAKNGGRQGNNNNQNGTGGVQQGTQGTNAAQNGNTQAQSGGEYNNAQPNGNQNGTGSGAAQQPSQGNNQNGVGGGNAQPAGSSNQNGNTSSVVNNTQTQQKSNKPWYKRLWNWVRGKKNEGYDMSRFDNMSINELYEEFAILEAQGALNG